MTKLDIVKGKKHLIPNPYLIIDFDDTLFPTKKYVQDMTNKFSSLTGNVDYFTPAYNQYRSEHDDFVDMKVICTLAQSQATEAGYSQIDFYAHFASHDLTPYQKELEENLAFLKSLKENGIPFIVVTQGNKEFQELKLKQSGFQKILDEGQFISTEEDKTTLIISQLIEHVPESNCIILDDKATALNRILESLKSLNQQPEGKNIKKLLQDKTYLVKIGDWLDKEKKLFRDPSFIDFQLLRPTDILRCLYHTRRTPEGNNRLQEMISTK